MNRRSNDGFTIIELTLAMTFVSMLLISVAMLSIQLTNQYSRGLTLKEVTQAGTEATNDMKRTLSQAQIGTTGIRLKKIVNGGWALCTGSYTYIANDPENLDKNNSYVIKVGSGVNKASARLMKITDVSGQYCSNTTLDTDGGKQVEVEDATELLSGGSRQLVVRSLALSPDTPTGIPTTGAFVDEFNLGRGICTVTMTIGTGVQSEIDATVNCKPPSDQNANIEFCAIDTFKFTTRVGSSNR